MAEKIVPVKYTDRDFNSIKQALLDHTRRYFPNTLKDFNEASFGALMLDTVSYVGDVLSFYLDYQVNESMLDTSIEVRNILNNARQMGYKYNPSFSSSGVLSMYVEVPASDFGTGPDTTYIPTLKKGSQFSTSGGNSFILASDVDFSNPENEVLVARVDSTTGRPTYYAIKAYGVIISGQLGVQRYEIGSFSPLRKVTINTPTVVEIIDVLDSEGHRYFEVDYLTQDTVYRLIRNRVDSSANSPKYVIKPVAVPRRFTVERTLANTILQFGYGSEGSLTDNNLLNLSDVTLERFGKNYVSSYDFDPSNLKTTDKLGVGPSNTTLSVVYRFNSRDNVNAAQGTITRLGEYQMEFNDETILIDSARKSVISSLEVINEEQIIGDVDTTPLEEVKIRAKSFYASQNRAVTKTDYINIAYRMPPELGSIYKTNIYQNNSNRYKKLDMYLVSKDSEGFLTSTNSVIKQNLKLWLNDYKMINDIIDILDAKIINFGVEFEVVRNIGYSKADALQEAREAIREYFENVNLEIGEQIYITDLYNILNSQPSINDTVFVKMTSKSGSNYSNIPVNIDDLLSFDGRILYSEKDAIYELKYPNSDIIGTVR